MNKFFGVSTKLQNKRGNIGTENLTFISSEMCESRNSMHIIEWQKTLYLILPLGIYKISVGSCEK